MKFTMTHTNFNIMDMEKSLEFYKNALGMDVVRRFKPDDGNFELAFLTDGVSSCQLELTWLKEKDTPYELGDNETHLAFFVDNYDEAYALHKEMGCICFENKTMGIYFIEDPDGYWLEIISARR